MAGNLLPIVLLAGGALLVAGGKKKRRRKKSADVYEWQEQKVQPTKPPAAAAQTSGPSGKAATSDVWKSRQTALAFVAGMKVCNCHPGKVDGIFGPATIAAIIAFQICAGITPDGKWGPKTDAAMKKMLVDIAKGQVKIAKPKRKIVVTIEDDHEHKPHQGFSDVDQRRLDDAIKSNRFEPIELHLGIGNVPTKILQVEKVGLPFHEDHTHTVSLSGEDVERLSRGQEVFKQSSNSIALSPLLQRPTAIGPYHTHFVKIESV